MDVGNKASNHAKNIMSNLKHEEHYDKDTRVAKLPLTGKKCNAAWGH